MQLRSAVCATEQQGGLRGRGRGRAERQWERRYRWGRLDAAAERRLRVTLCGREWQGGL